MFVAPFVISFFLGVGVPILISLFAPEPLLSILRPQHVKVVSLGSNFSLLSLNRNNLAAARFSACLTLSRLFSVLPFCFRCTLTFYSTSFGFRQSSIKFRVLSFAVQFIRAFTI